MIKLSVDQWCAIKGLSIQTKRYAIKCFCSLLAGYRLRKMFKFNWSKEIVSWEKNRRTTITEWDYDLTILGFTFQFQKYKPFMMKPIS